ncbi:MAG: hypothetical protein WAX14_07740 [Rhodococcus sp. (in: high G+C Gram-positive bacteria)]|uniref:hypothetical protein n=1 Tax=Rhodococcus sp. TaxID=1831 RepID=UPI003BB52456
MDIFYIACLAIGLVGIVGTLIVGEIGSEFGGDGLPFLNLTTVATASLGVGVGGGAATLLGFGSVPAAVAAAGTAAIMVLVTRGVLLPYLLRQQGNSHTGRASYLGLTGVVTLTIEPGGWGEITFTDTEGNRVRSRAVSTETAALPANSRVYIGDLDDDVLHVVSIPDDPRINP